MNHSVVSHRIPPRMVPKGGMDPEGWPQPHATVSGFFAAISDKTVEYWIIKIRFDKPSRFRVATLIQLNRNNN